MAKQGSFAARGACDYVLAPFSLALLLLAYWPVWLVVRTKRVLQ